MNPVTRTVPGATRLAQATEEDWVKAAARLYPALGNVVDALGREGASGSDALAYLRACPPALAQPVLTRVSR